jgi:hypothetical protein
MHLYFASTYGSGTYDSTTYNGSSTVSLASTGSNKGNSSGQTGNTSAGGSLTNTGFDLVLIASLACVIMFVALIVKLWHKSPANV